MQYLLTEEEFKTLVHKKELKVVTDECFEAFLILQAAIDLPCADRKRFYCDNCMLKKLKHVCTRSRSYSK